MEVCNLVKGEVCHHSTQTISKISKMHLVTTLIPFLVDLKHQDFKEEADKDLYKMVMALPKVLIWDQESCRILAFKSLMERHNLDMDK